MIESSSVLLFNGNYLLLLRRSKTDSWMPFAWDTPGGGIDEGETPLQGMYREAYEEAGIHDISDVEKFWTRRTPGYISHIYIASTNQDKVTLSFEHDRYQWIHIDDINPDSINLVNRVRQCVEKLKTLRKKHNFA